ncbi:hypothetical protein DN395_27275, partial [Bacillus sp. AR18-7]
TLNLQSLYSLFSQNTLVTDCFICKPYLSPFTPPYIFILNNENLFFLTYSLQIPYIRNCFYNRVAVASMSESAKTPMLFASVFFCTLHIEDSFYS